MQRQYKQAYDKLVAGEPLKNRLVNAMKNKHYRPKFAWMVPVSAVACLIFCFALLFPMLHNSLVPMSSASGVQGGAQLNSEGSPAEGLFQDSMVQNFLVLGVDSQEGKDNQNIFADSIMMISLDAREKKIKLTSFNREMILDQANNPEMKLNAWFNTEGGSVGVEKTKTVIENAFGVQVDNWVVLSMSHFNEFVTAVCDAVTYPAVEDRTGIIRVELSQEEADLINKNAPAPYDSLEEGENFLTSEQMLYYTRLRTNSDGDSIGNAFRRDQRQRQVVRCLLELLKDVQENPTGLVYLADAVFNMVESDMNAQDLLELARTGEPYLSYEVEELQLPGDDQYDKEKLLGGNESLQMQVIPDLEACSATLKEFLYGEAGVASSTESKASVESQNISKLPQSTGDPALSDLLEETVDSSLLISGEPEFAFSSPLSGGHVTEAFGEKGHSGVDMAVSSMKSQSVLAVADGVVVYADTLGTQADWKAGRYVVLSHGDGWYTVYAHLSQVLVSPGRQIGVGSIIGKTGDTGYVNGDCVHFSIYKDGLFYQPQVDEVSAGKPIDILVDLEELKTGEEQAYGPYELPAGSKLTAGLNWENGNKMYVGWQKAAADSSYEKNWNRKEMILDGLDGAQYEMEIPEEGSYYLVVGVKSSAQVTVANVTGRLGIDWPPQTLEENSEGVSAISISDPVVGPSVYYGPYKLKEGQQWQAFLSWEDTDGLLVACQEAAYGTSFRETTMAVTGTKSPTSGEKTFTVPKDGEYYFILRVEYYNDVYNNRANNVKGRIEITS